MASSGPVAGMVGLLMLAAGCASPSADLALLGGRVWTGTSLTLPQPGHETTALAVRSGRVIAVGSDAEIVRLIGPQTTKLALNGRRVVPGFMDNHIHFISGGLELDDRCPSNGATASPPRPGPAAGRRAKCASASTSNRRDPCAARPRRDPV